MEEDKKNNFNSSDLENIKHENSEQNQEITNENLEISSNENILEVIEIEEEMKNTTAESKEEMNNSSSAKIDSFIIQQQINQSNGMGIAGFVLAILAIFLSWIPVLNWILWILGLVFSIIGMTKKPKGFAIAGLVISLIGIVVMLFLIAIIAAIFATSAI